MMSTSRHRPPRGLGGSARPFAYRSVAARLIVEHGLTDWTLAKRKALRQLMLPDTTAMPSNDEIEVALAEHQRSSAARRYGKRPRDACASRCNGWTGSRVAASARRRRRRGMGDRAQRHPLELVADDPKAVEIDLASHDVVYTALPPRAGDGGTHLRIESSAAALRGKVRPRSASRSSRRRQRRNRPRKSDEPRLDLEAVSALVGEGGSSGYVASALR
jgi:hypothetical protein